MTHQKASHLPTLDGHSVSHREPSGPSSLVSPLFVSLDILPNTH